MAARRGKSQARRNSSTGIPGWAWLIAGLVLGAILIISAPRFLKSDAADGFFRPQPNPDARPAATASAEDDDAIVPEGTGNASAPGADKPKATTYDFYTMLPGNEVVLSDAELAASERAEAERAAKAEATTAPVTPQATGSPDATTAPTDAATAGTAASQAAPTPATAAAQDAAAARYLLQAGAFQASGDAEAVKAKIALLGLSARVESAQVKDRTVYRVRMGPYGTASELAEAKRKLAGGGLPAMAIKAN